MTSRRTVLGLLGRSIVVMPFVGVAVACSSDEEEPDDTISPWSVSPSYGSGWDPSLWAEQVAGAGVANVRGFRVDSDGYDTIRAAGFTSTGILQWSPGDEQRFPVDDLAGWQDYVDSTVRAFPEVRQWEVWNEPPNFTTDTSAASYASILQVAHDAVKAVDATLQVGLATKSTNTAWLREAVTAGAEGHYDYVTVHPYERAGAVVDGWEEPYLAIVPQLRAMLAEVDPDNSGVPVEFTEVGAPAAQQPGGDDPLSTPEEQARTLVKALTMAVAQGVQRVSWYDPYDGDFSGGEAAFGLIAQDGTARPSFGAYANLIAALGRRPTFVGTVRPQPDTYVFVFAADDGTAGLVAWTQGPERELSFAQSVGATSASTGQVVMRSTVSLNADPMIVAVTDPTDAADWLSQARAAERDESGLRSAVTWTADGGPDGLFVRGLGDPVTDEGRTGRAPEDSVVYLAVGPDFDWAASVVEVTVTVRGTRDAAGFNLKYDAAAPLASLDSAGQRSVDTGWQQPVPGEWRTVTWTLNDVRLAGMYGYNFRLDSDSPSYSGYQLESVTLEVLASRTVPGATPRPGEERGPGRGE